MYCRLLTLFALMILAGCGNNNTSREPFEYAPVVLIVFTEMVPLPELPWDIQGVGLSKAVLATRADETEIDVADRLINSALDSGLLLCLVNYEMHTDSLSREHIIINDDESITVQSSPPEVFENMDTDTWSQPAGRNTLLVEIINKYRPDLLISTERNLNIESVNEIASVWFNSELTDDITIIFYSPPVETITRGWAVFGGPSINGSIAKGLSPCNLLATAKVLTGLPWDDSIPELIPAVGILNAPDNIFENGSIHD